MIQGQNQYPEPGTQMPPLTAMYHPMIITNNAHHQSQPSPVFNQPQYHQYPTMNEQNSPVSSLSLPLLVAPCPTTTTLSNDTNFAAASSSPPSTDETLSNVSSVSSIPTILTPTLLPYAISPVSTGLCSPTVVSMDNVQTAWIAPGSTIGYAPQARLYSPSPAPSFVPYTQPMFTPSPPPMSYEAIFGRTPPPPSTSENAQQAPHFTSPQSNQHNTPSPPRANHFNNQHCHNTFPEENDEKNQPTILPPTRHSLKKKGGCVQVSMSNTRNRKNFRVRCKACSAPVSRQVVKEVRQEDLENAFADQNEILDQLPEYFGEPLLNFPEIVFYMQIFKAKSKENEELQYFKVPRPAKERELHIDHRLTELFIRNFGFDHACEHHEFKRLPVHQPGICHARNLYRQLIVDSLLPTFLAYVRNMDEAKRLFGIIFRYVGCATPRDIASNLPQVWKAVTNVDGETSLEITGIVSLYNYHLFRRLIEKEDC